MQNIQPGMMVSGVH